MLTPLDPAKRHAPFQPVEQRLSKVAARRPSLVGVASRASVVACLLALLAATVAAQGGRTVTGRGTMEMNSRRERIEREITVGTLDGRPVKTAERAPAPATAAQVRQDFERTQALYNGLARAVSAGGALDYKFVAATTAEINKRASRLKSNLALPRHADDGGDKARAKQPARAAAAEADARAELDAARLRSTLVSLGQHVVSFMTNPLFEPAAALDVELSTKAARDLDRIIELSAHVSKNAERLSKSHD